MMTNIITMLHTTVAYKAAVLQLMVGQANFAAKQLELNEPLPITIPADTNKWEVEPPPMGVSGMILTSNYDFEFSKGRLSRLGKRDWFKKLSPSVENTSELTNRVSLIDTNGAYQLAAQWLATLSVNVPELENKFPPHVKQSVIRRQTPGEKPDEFTVTEIPLPIFEVSWGNQSSLILGMNPVFIKIYGPTKEITSLGFRRDSLEQIPFNAPTLEVTNAAKLLGPLPPPEHFVSKLFGGGAAYETVRSPDYVEVWLLNSATDQREQGKPAERARPKKLEAKTAKDFSSVLLDFNSYAWTEMKLCSPDFGLRLRFTRGLDCVEFIFCYDCDILEVTHNGHKQQENFDFAHNRLVKAAQNAFPWDKIIQRLELNDGAASRAEYERMLRPFEH